MLTWLRLEDTGRDSWTAQLLANLNVFFAAGSVASFARVSATKEVIIFLIWTWPHVWRYRKFFTHSGQEENFGSVDSGLNNTPPVHVC